MNLEITEPQGDMETETAKKRTVCIIDDEADLREIYGTGFKREGFVVLTAENGEEGLAVIRREHPDAIILDLQMPVMDGFAVLKALKADPVLSDIPVVILSNVDDEKTFHEAEGSQSCYYLLKVLTTPQKAVDIVCEALREKSEAS